MRVLHIVENLDRGAVENWLVRMLRHARKIGAEVQWTFYCTLGRPGRLDDEVRELGARVVHSPVPLGRQAAFVRALRRELTRGEYDVLHSHHDLVSGVYLVAALGLPIRRRFVHVHNADEAVLTPSPFKKAVYRPLLRRTCLTLADGVVGISNHTLDTFLGGRSRRPGRDRVHYYGIDPASFLVAKGDWVGFRRKLGLPEDSRILLFAGRMVPEKNPLFAVDVFAAMRMRDPKVAGVFVGAGSLEQAVRERAEALGVLDGFRALGWRDDLPDVMTCCDWFILPRPEHPMEGLGIAVVEAQLAGLRMLLSEGIADDPLLPGAVWRRLPLSAGAAHWGETGLALFRQTPPDCEEAAATLAKSPFDLDVAWRDLRSLHG